MSQISLYMIIQIRTWVTKILIIQTYTASEMKQCKFINYSLIIIEQRLLIYFS